jgi:hypothetical protein
VFFACGRFLLSSMHWKVETNSVEMVLVDEKVRWFTIYIILILFLIAFCIIVINFVEF